MAALVAATHEHAPSRRVWVAGTSPAMTREVEAAENPLLHHALRLGDDALILGKRLSEWCGHAPMLEVDLALANIGLDLLGQATHFLNLAGEIEAEGRDADALTFHRDVLDFRN